MTLETYVRRLQNLLSSQIVHPDGVNKLVHTVLIVAEVKAHHHCVHSVCTSFGWAYGGNIASVGWQVKLGDPV